MPDYQEFLGENRSFVKHEMIFPYLRNCTEHFNLSRYIKILLFLVGVRGSVKPKKLVCIIGAGASGLTSARQLSHDLNNARTIVFERGTDIGGQWKYTDSTDLDENGLPVHSGVYKNLRTNSPKVQMTFPDYQEFHGENRTFIKHETILQYLRNYTEHFNLRRYIKFDTLVEKVRLLHNKRWSVHTRHLKRNTMKVYFCDAVMVCVGNYFKPNLPVIPGLDTFSGRSLHSHSYRKPEEYANKTVVILGASYSGKDVGIDISNYAKTVYLSHRHSKLTGELPENMIQIPGVVAANGSELILSDGSRVRADAFIMCTGYQYYYPFLDDSSGINVTEGKYIHPLYKHFININHPTLVFLGVPSPNILIFQVAYYQAKYFVSLLRGDKKLPSREVMLKESQLPPGIPTSKAHVMFAGVPYYIDDVAQASGIKISTEEMKRVLSCNIDIINDDYLHFRDDEIIVRDDGRVDLILPNKTTSECLLQAKTPTFSINLL